MVDTAWQRVVVLALWLLFFAVLLVSAAAVVTSLSDANVTSFGKWVASHSSSIAAFLIGAIPAFGAFFFGRQSGRKVGTKETFASSVATASGKTTGDEAAEALRNEAIAHGVKV